MTKLLVALDLDGTLLNSDKQLSVASIEAVRDMVARGAVVALASGRLGASIMPYAKILDIDPVIMLNGAAVFVGPATHRTCIYSAALPIEASDYLLHYATGREFNLNFYGDDKLYALCNATTRPWIDLYRAQTSSPYVFVESWDCCYGRAPSKMIFVGDTAVIDKEEKLMRSHFGDSLYIVRSWDHYLEFLHPLANKGRALQALAGHYTIPLAKTIAFGDADNDIPMLELAGYSAVCRNASDGAKRAAKQVLPWTNDEDGVARGWYQYINK